MDQTRLYGTLADLHLGGIRYFNSLGSTNDEAAHWAQEGASEFSLVVADEQTAGRGRQGRTWVTVPGASLAFSIVLYPRAEEVSCLPRLTALGALAVRDALQEHYSLPAQIKWPNDVVLHRQKVAGVLAEALWTSSRLQALILGIGINVLSPSVSSLSGSQAVPLFPAAYVQAFLDYALDPVHLLHDVLVELMHWRAQVTSSEFMQAWQSSLAFREENVQIFDTVGAVQDIAPAAPQEGRLVGLAPDGSLLIRDQAGEVVAVRFGEVRLRPVEKS